MPDTVFAKLFVEIMWGQEWCYYFQGRLMFTSTNFLIYTMGQWKKICLLHELFWVLNQLIQVKGLRYCLGKNQCFIVYKDRNVSDTTLKEIFVSDLR